jgi:hypothetical protein
MQGKTVDFILKIEFSSLVELLFSLGLQKPIENKGFSAMLFLIKVCSFSNAF